MQSTDHWARFNEWLLRTDSLGVSLDVSRMNHPDGFLASMETQIGKAFDAMRDLERGAIANPDEGRMVGHYWLRQPSLAPSAEITQAIRTTLESIKTYSAAVHSGECRPPSAERFTDCLLVGIGGSALGPQFISDALGSAGDPIRLHFLDNTDPDGMERLFDTLGDHLKSTLVVVISKSGGTKETRNGMLQTAARFEKAGLNFAKHSVAVTGDGSELDQHAAKEGWLQRFPMWDWVGGRTSVMSAVGLLPMALQGLDVDAFLGGAAAMDEHTRIPEAASNAAMLLALMWYHAGGGRGAKDMVMLPYKDRLLLLSKYLQQLVMESLGKSLDLDGNTVNQGIAVYGNKGSTDQHAYVQQLRDGVNNFFVTFIEVRQDVADGAGMEVEPGITSGDYLQGFFRGTRLALAESGRESMTISVPAVTAFHVGALIALFERAVGFYASLVNINAYHQPGVEAGKKAATRILKLQEAVLSTLRESAGTDRSAKEIAADCGADPEDVFHILVHLAANRSGLTHSPGARPADDRFRLA